jgi:hypothetical protein
MEAGDVPSSRNARGPRLVNKLGASEVALAPDKATLSHGPGPFFNDQKLHRDQSHRCVQPQAHTSLRYVTHRVRKSFLSSGITSRPPRRRIVRSTVLRLIAPPKPCLSNCSCPFKLASHQKYHDFVRHIEAIVFEVNSDDVATLMRLLKLDTASRLSTIGRQCKKR